MTDEDLDLFDRVIHDVRGAVGTATQALSVVAKGTPEGAEHPLAHAGMRTLARLLRRTETAAAVHRLRTKFEVETVLPLPIVAAVERATAEVNALGPRHPLAVATVPASLTRPLPPRLFSAVLTEFLALGLRHAHGPSQLVVLETRPFANADEGGARDGGPETPGPRLRFVLAIPLHTRARLPSIEALAEDDHVPLALLRLGAARMGGSFSLDGPTDEPRSELSLELP